MISVIVPAYNAQDTIKLCLGSVLNQDYKDIEVIVINDGSVDNSLKIITSFNDPRLKIISTLNQGISKARNIGLENAKGDYVCFVDADDYLTNEHSLTDLIQRPADLVVGGFIRDYLNKNDMKYYAGRYLLRPHKAVEFAYVWGKLFRREIIEKNKIRFKVFMDKHEDTEFVFNYLYYCQDAYITGKSVYTHFYPINGAGMKIIDSRISCEALLNTIGLLGVPEDYINQARVSLKITEIVRAYRLSFIKHYCFIVGLLDVPMVRGSLYDYEAMPGDSKMIPLLIKLRLYLLLTIVCRIRGRKRYA